MSESTCPKQLGKYRILKTLGQGSTSIVYLAEDPFAQRQVAVKFFCQPQTGTDSLKQRVLKIFLNEASLVGQLNHPHIVSILDAVVDPENRLLVMEHVDGGTIEPYCQVDRLFPVQRVVEIIFKCTKALEYAQQHGIIHRDIKPANILLTSDGEIKISDFGSALLERTDQTQLSGMGSPAYMAPEQLRDEALSQQADIYALGLVMYQLLTGYYPYNAASHVSLVYQILNSEPPTPSIYRRDIPEALNQIVLKAIQKDVDQRYSNWQEFGDDLMAIAGGISLQGLNLKETRITDTEKFNAIKGLSFFQDFSEIQIWEVLRITHWRKLAKGERIIQEGEVGELFYVLSQGEAKVTRGKKVLSALQPGDCFGEMLYFHATSTIRTTSVITTSDAVVIEINASALSQASDACQVQFNKAFLRILDQKISRLLCLVADASA